VKILRLVVPLEPGKIFKKFLFKFA
jgi:hypothetical protein